MKEVLLKHDKSITLALCLSMICRSNLRVKQSTPLNPFTGENTPPCNVEWVKTTLRWIQCFY